MREAVRRRERIGLSAMSLIEIAVAFNSARLRKQVQPQQVLTTLDTSDDFEILPITTEIATEVAAMGESLRDPGDLTIVCTARIHRLRLVTSDQRIIESKLVPVVE
jgi:PIN domain nuclease of toxin-antitoxin system